MSEPSVIQSETRVVRVPQQTSGQVGSVDIPQEAFLAVLKVDE